MSKTETLVAVILLFFLFLLAMGVFSPYIPDHDWTPINQCLNQVMGPCYTPTPLPWWQFWGH